MHLSENLSFVSTNEACYAAKIGDLSGAPDDVNACVAMFPSAAWGRLRLSALDATDLALSKLERNEERDREDFLRLARAGLLDPLILKERYYAELRPYLLSKLPWQDKTLELWLQMAWPST